MTEGALREKRAGVKGLLRFFSAKQIVISDKVLREKDVDRESASAAMGTRVPWVAQKETGPIGLAPQPDPCLPEAFAPRACGRRTMGNERNWKTESPAGCSSESQGRKLPALIGVLRSPALSLLTPLPQAGMFSTHPGTQAWILRACLVDNSGVSHSGTR